MEVPDPDKEAEGDDESKSANESGQPKKWKKPHKMKAIPHVFQWDGRPKVHQYFWLCMDDWLAPMLNAWGHDMTQQTWV